MNAYTEVNNHFMIAAIITNQILYIFGKINSPKRKEILYWKREKKK